MGPTPPSVRSISCPNCGGTVQLRGLGRTVSAVCIQCLSVIDTSSPALAVVQKFQSKERYQPLIPLGTRGKVRGDAYEAIGFQVRELVVEGVSYTWAEYVLFNPYKGFRYLTEYKGHWNDVYVLTSVPEVSGGGRSKRARHLNENFRHFQSYTAATIYVMGEFPWQVRVGESAVCDDYVDPPRILSSERSGNEVVWSLGEYTSGDIIWHDFQLKGAPSAATGVFANQPSPYKHKVSKAWARFLFWAMVLMGLQLLFSMAHSDQFVFSRHFRFQPQAAKTDNSFVTETFDIKGRTSSVEVSIKSSVAGAIFYNLALINEDTGRALDFGREAKFRDHVVLASVPSGKYYLRIEPETPYSNIAEVQYQIDVRRDVTTWAFFVIGLILLLVPPVFTLLQSSAFEGKRWQESDYAPETTSSSEDDE